METKIGLASYRTLVDEAFRDAPLNIKQNIEATVRSEDQARNLSHI